MRTKRYELGKPRRHPPPTRRVGLFSCPTGNVMMRSGRDWRSLQIAVTTCSVYSNRVIRTGEMRSMRSLSCVHITHVKHYMSHIHVAYLTEHTHSRHTFNREHTTVQTYALRARTCGFFFSCKAFSYSTRVCECATASCWGLDNYRKG